MTAHEGWLELCAGYALGCLDAEDAQALERHLAGGCGQCEQALADYGEAGLALACDAEPLPLPPGLLGAVMEAVEAESRDPVPTPAPLVARVPSPVWRWAAAGLVLLALGGLVWTWQLLDDERNDNAALQSQLTELRDDAARLRQALEDLGTEKDAIEALCQSIERQLGMHRELLIGMLSEVGVQRLALRPTGAATADPEAVGWVGFDRDQGRALLVFEDLAVAPGKALELWAVRGEGEVPTSLGLLEPDAEGRAVLLAEKLEASAGISGFAVSLEPPGGAPGPGPSGDVVLFGKSDG